MMGDLKLVWREVEQRSREFGQGQRSCLGGSRNVNIGCPLYESGGSNRSRKDGFQSAAR